MLAIYPAHLIFLDSMFVILAKSTSYEAPHYAVLSNLLSLHSSSVQIFSSAPCPQTPSVYVPPLMSETKFHAIQNHRKNYIIYIQMFKLLDSRREDKMFWTER
jgi:hypothetical protein